MDYLPLLDYLHIFWQFSKVVYREGFRRSFLVLLAFSLNAENDILYKKITKILLVLHPILLVRTSGRVEFYTPV